MTLGAFNQRFGVIDLVRNALSAGGSGGVVSGVLGAGVVVLGVLADTIIVFVLSVYFLADLPRIRRGLFRLTPHTRRPRVILIGDQVFAKVGSYVLGILVLSAIAGVSSLVWMWSSGCRSRCCWRPW